MFGTQDLALFIVSGLLLNISPGPDSLLIMTRSASQGFRAGSAASLGIGAGTFVHIFAAALGLSAVIATSATAFAVVKYLGAAYLVYIGLSMIWQSRKDQTQASLSPVVKNLSRQKIFAQGFLTNVLNPKVAIFFLAFVPQFIAADSPNKPVSFLILGLIFNVNGMVWCHLVAASTAFAGNRLRANAMITRWINRGIGTLFLSLGARLALAERA